tara:strand:- start:75 stop:263 length:189 start_codon:yes stop_codon:yes gene_type:complete
MNQYKEKLSDLEEKQIKDEIYQSFKSITETVETTKEELEANKAKAQTASNKEMIKDTEDTCK